MTGPDTDSRTLRSRNRDEVIAAEPPLAPPDLPADAEPATMETHLARLGRRPLAAPGIVENGLARPLKANEE